jgi:hypothetical protein
MKQTLDLARVAGPDHTCLLPTTGSRPHTSPPAPPTNLPISDESSHSASAGAVWMFLVISILVTLAASYLFWAKLSSAWPFSL